MIRPSPPLVFGAEAEAEAAVVEKASLQEKGGDTAAARARRTAEEAGANSKRRGGRSEGGGEFAISPITRSVTEQKELSCLTIALPSSPIGGRVVSCNC